MLDELEPGEWGAPSLCSRWSVRDVVGHLVWRVGGSYGEMLRSVLPLPTLTRSTFAALTDAVSRQEGEASSPEELTRRLRRIADLRRAGVGRTGLGDLVETVVHTYDIVQPLGVRIDVEPEATRRIAVRGMLLASPERLAAAGQRTLWAADAGWAIGRGPVIEGTAQGIVLYLYGRSPLVAGSR
ncbi:maleylpyruvate isomerase family mycothiol-dependent enzyme [Humibacter ginsenosidimutans]|uniref:Maleylpyruvate isomerase family mycothiol-dependent enzyme n=1 Tax=Humibacter ginsenosidimutans TaxID=2599293 RepID=A0A5B8M0B5_9MICO|nr:maleylpyruvate isomerase family mycothiol-dependent enzyme [Humibacter ginsenosidimutans]QDZ13449.1 maleylpyruvate isomerase family mycothiol-dependent enzyme [Humibacter ginsenosidimutans]